MDSHLLLYGTEGCHLCEEATRIVEESLAEAPVTVDAIDIVQDEALLTRYGTRIPVLKRVGGMAELNWPFTHEQVVLLAWPTGPDLGR